MGHWALVKLAVSVFPRGWGREAVLRHIDRCPACQARLIGREDARRWLVQADDLGRLDGIWPAVRKAMDFGPVAAAQSGAACRSASPSPGPGPRFLRWAAAAGAVGSAAAVIMLTLAVFIPRGVEYTVGAAEPADALRIQSASIAGKPADAYIIDIPEDRMILVWIEQKPGQGGRS